MNPHVLAALGRHLRVNHLAYAVVVLKLGAEQNRPRTPLAAHLLFERTRMEPTWLGRQLA